MGPSCKPRLAEKTAIITGAAGAIGRVACRMFCNEGALVIGVDRDEIAGSALINVMRDYGDHFLFLKADLTSEVEIDALVEAVRTRFDVIDILYNNAGVISDHHILEMTLAEWDAVQKVNVTSVFLLMKAFAPLFKGGRGSIVNTASTTGLFASKDGAAYCTSKAAVLMLTKAAAVDLGPDIRVNAVLPGTLATGMPLRARPGRDEEYSNAVLARAAAGTPLKRLGSAEEVVSLALFLASDDASFVTGSSYAVDGGRSAV